MRRIHLNAISILLLVTGCVSTEPQSIQTKTATIAPALSGKTPIAATASFTPTVTPTFMPAATPTLLGNTGQIIYSAWAGDNPANSTGIIMFDLTTGTSMQIAPPGTTISAVSPDSQKYLGRDANENDYVGIFGSEYQSAVFLYNKVQPIWFPDSTHIVYAQDGPRGSRDRNIYISNVDGTDATCLTQQGDQPIWPVAVTVSPDGKRLFYATFNGFLKYINLETSEQVEISKEVYSWTNFAFEEPVSPTGEQLATWRNTILMLSNTDKPGFKLLMGSDSINPSLPRPERAGKTLWTPDGNELIASVWICSPECDKTSVYIFSSSSGKLINQFPVIDGFLEVRDVSPDGRLVLLFGHENSSYKSKPILYIIDIETLNVQRFDDKIEFPTPPSMGDSGWYPDIQWMPAVTSNGSVTP